MIERKLTKEQRDAWREKLPKGPPRYGYQATMEMMLDDLDEADRELEKLTDAFNRVFDENRYIRSLADGREEKLRAKLAEADKTIEQACEQLDQKDEQLGEMRKKLAEAEAKLAEIKSITSFALVALDALRSKP